MDLDQRPPKKRRFFVEDDENDKDGSNADTPTFAAASRRTSISSSLNEQSSSQTDLADIDHDAHEVDYTGFDEDIFRGFVGEDSLSQDVVRRVRDAANGNMERAINMYFDGSWQSTDIRPSTLYSWASKSVPQKDSTTPPTTVIPDHTIALKRMPEKRYLGSFGAACWTTRSGVNILASGEPVSIGRSKLQPRTKIGRGGKVVQIVGRNQKSDVVTRFANMKGDELGRLPEETAKWVSTLLDQKICTFEANCVYAPDRVRVNDTVYLQLKCYILRTAFEASAFIKPRDDNRVTGIFEEKESVEEKDLRLRQVALVKLFDEINLNPVLTNEMAAKHKKAGLLRSAEMAEQFDKEDASKTRSSGTSTPAGELEVQKEDGQELEEEQLDALYSKAQSFDFDTPEAEPANSFVLNLRKYQKQALHWMLKKELNQKSERQASMHPLWEEYAWPLKDADEIPLPSVENQDKFYVNIYNGEVSLDLPIQEDDCLGGILADEMGLGKTIEMLALIHTNQSAAARDAAVSAKSLSGSITSLQRLPRTSSIAVEAPCTTLVVAPMSLLAQWESEAVKASNGSMRTLVYYGNEKSINLQTLCSVANAASAPHLLITSYGNVLSEFNQIAAAGGDRYSSGGLFSIEFFRVILDEGHTIKNRQAKTSKACYEIVAKHRWVLTGTPIVNRLEDLFSLVRFLRVEPWNNFSFWKTFITVPFESKDFLRALNVVQTVLEPLVIRRTKDMKTPDGQPLVPLPAKEIRVEEIELSKTEREVYDLIFMRAKRAFHESLQAGTVLKSYTTIFAQILRLRQSCCHPILVRNKDIVADEEDAAIVKASDSNGLADDTDLADLINRFTEDADAAARANSNAEAQDFSMTFTEHALRQIQSDSSGECPICTEEPMEFQAVTHPCFHSACKKCLEDYISHQIDKGQTPRCFSCRETINLRDIFEVVKYSGGTPGSSADDMYEGESSNQKPPRISLRRINPYSPSAATSAKIAALLKHLIALPRNTKSVVFSQFTSFLDLIAPQLTRHNIHHLRFDGTMSQKFRSGVLREFTAENASDSNAPKVLLLSLRAGGVGLNLTAASRCYMMDPWWAFAVEAQAIDRVHRMGQTSNVEVIRFITKDSIEGRILRVQERKMAVAGSLGIGQNNGEGGEEEKKRRRIEELEMLLG